MLIICRFYLIFQVFFKRYSVKFTKIISRFRNYFSTFLPEEIDKIQITLYHKTDTGGEIKMNTENFSDIAILGMGTMGANLARNFVRHGIRTAIWNRTLEKAAFIAGESPFFRVAVTLEELALHLAPPRKVLMMLPAGTPTSETAGELQEILSPGDIIINGANSTAGDSDALRRSLARKGILYVGLGISGGSRGALEGPSFMAGGSREGWEATAPLLLKCAAESPSGSKCAAYFGEGGAGHLVKIVHNGIEYAQMEIIAEICDFLRRSYGAGAPMIADFLQEQSARHNFRSYLVDLTVNIMQEEDPESPGWLIDHIADQAGSKGTGTACLQYALQAGFPLPAMTQALLMRQLSASSRWRTHRIPAAESTFITGDSISADCIGRGMKAAMLETFAEGMALLDTIFADSALPLDMALLANVWSNGCIIRSELLEIWKNLQFPVQANTIFPPQLDNMLMTLLPSWKQLILTGISCNIPMPALTAAWEYYLLSGRSELPTYVTAAQRDAFGSHMFKRKGENKYQHHNWRLP